MKKLVAVVMFAVFSTLCFAQAPAATDTTKTTKKATKAKTTKAKKTTAKKTTEAPK
ncbi:MAG: hypothetical protein ACLQBJ_16595 [Bryobacteraceae bacterium]